MIYRVHMRNVGDLYGNNVYLCFNDTVTLSL